MLDAKAESGLWSRWHWGGQVILLSHVILFVIQGPKAVRRTWVREAPITAGVRWSQSGQSQEAKGLGNI